MNIPSAHCPAIRGRGPVTKPVDQLFTEKGPKGSFTETLQDVYYSKPSDSKLLSEVTETKQEKYKELLDQAVKEGHLSPQQAAERQETFLSGSMGPYTPMQKTPPGAKVLDILHQMDDEQFCLVRHPQQVGDGLYRPMDFYISPGHLTLKAAAQGWEVSKDANGEQIPVADVVVVGGGPGGLTTSWQLARRGGRVVCFESELAGSNFNDGGAKAVHHMRTSADFTNLVNEGHSAASLEHPLSLSGNLAVNRSHALAGREGQTKLTGEVMHGVPEDSLVNITTNPATRGELWDHLSGLSYSLANDFPDAVLCERSPVAEVTYDEKDGLFTVTTTRGHKIKSKEVVLSTGLTGPKGERARSLKVLDNLHESAPDKSVVLQQIGDTQLHADRLTDLAKGESQGTLIVNDRLLGDQTFRQTFAALGEGERAAVIGSGESGIKGALELAHLNPKVTVDLFVKGYLESAQVQVPSENFRQPVIEKTLNDPVASKALADMYKVFDTPVTPRSLQEVFELQQSGRMRIFELGSYFDEKSIALSAQEDGTTKLEIKDPKVAEQLAKNEADYKSKGLMPAEQSLSGGNYRAFIQAAGYHKLQLEDHPLAQLPEEAKAKLHVNTIANSIHPAQSALPGLGTAGRHLAEDLAKRLVPDDRRVQIVMPTDRGVDYRNWSKEDVNAIILNLGQDPMIAESIKREIAEKGHSDREYLLYLTSVDPKLREVAEKPDSERTPAERELLERGLHLGRRLYKAASEVYKSIAS